MASGAELLLDGCDKGELLLAADEKEGICLISDVEITSDGKSIRGFAFCCSSINFFKNSPFCFIRS